MPLAHLMSAPVPMLPPAARCKAEGSLELLSLWHLAMVAILSRTPNLPGTPPRSRPTASASPSLLPVAPQVTRPRSHSIPRPRPLLLPAASRASRLESQTCNWGPERSRPSKLPLRPEPAR